MSIVRIAHRPRWTSIANTALEDKRLSFKARGLLAYLLSKPDTWECRVSELVQASDPDGVTSIRSALDELTRYGYAMYEQPREHGQFAAGGWTIRETPQAETPYTGNLQLEQPITSNGVEAPQEKPYADFPSAENHPLSKDLKRVRTEKKTPIGDLAKSPLYSAGFLNFWAGYPVKKGKASAWKAWQRLQCEPLTRVIVASVIQHQQEDPDWKRGYIKHPATYLNGRCWEDEFARPSQPLHQRTLVL